MWPDFRSRGSPGPVAHPGGSTTQSLSTTPGPAAVFTGVSAVEIVLRPEMANDLGPVLALGSMDGLETFFASLGQADAMYGWSFFDIEDPGADWNQPPSLLLHVPTANPSPH